MTLCAHIHRYIHTFIFIYTNQYTSIFIYTSVYTFKYIYIYLYTHSYTYNIICTRAQAPKVGDLTCTHTYINISMCV